MSSRPDRQAGGERAAAQPAGIVAAPTVGSPRGPLPIVLVSGPAPLERVGGRTLVGRIVEQLRRAGCPAGLVVCPAAQIEAVRELTATTAASYPVQSDQELVARTLPAAAPGQLLLLVDGAVVYDHRLIVDATTWTSPGALVDGAPGSDRPWRRTSSGKPFAGLLALRPADLRAALAAGRPLLDPVSLCALPGVEHRDVDRLPVYSREIRRPLRPFWQEALTAADRERAARRLAAAAGKGHMELMVLLCNRPLETFLARHVSDLAVTPNQLTLLSLLSGFLAVPLFAHGVLGWAVLLAVATGLLDGLDGRQARIQMRTSKLGELEHVGDKLVEIGWMLALGWWLSRGGSDRWIAGGTLAWVGFHFLDNGAYAYFRARRRMMIDEATPLDGLIRVLASTRNNNVLALAIGLGTGAVVTAYRFILVWAAVTALVHWARALLLLRRPEATSTWGERLAGGRSA